MNKFSLVQKEIFKLLPNSPVKTDVLHAKRVLHWLLKLKPQADEALKISAISHDIDRAITGITESDLQDYSQINEFKQEHALRSAVIIGKILTDLDYDQKTINQVIKLVSHHEVGGSPEANVLKTADSLSYFENNIPIYLQRNGLVRSQQKIRFMFDRLSPSGKKMVRQMKFKNKKIGDLVRKTIN